MEQHIEDRSSLLTLFRIRSLMKATVLFKNKIYRHTDICHLCRKKLRLWPGHKIDLFISPLNAKIFSDEKVLISSNFNFLRKQKVKCNINKCWGF